MVIITCTRLNNSVLPVSVQVHHFTIKRLVTRQLPGKYDTIHRRRYSGVYMLIKLTGCRQRPLKAPDQIQRRGNR
ncbi:hypothetical protein KJI55_005290 [Escherichia coli]|nr:hypothetical protein [Escherichia coli]